MISRNTEVIIKPGEKISTVWAYLKQLPRADLHYFVHEFGTTNWWHATSPGASLIEEQDFAGVLHLIKNQKAFWVVVDNTHYILVWATHETYDINLRAIKDRFTCQIITSSS